MYKIKYNKLFPFKGYIAMALFGRIWIRHENKDRINPITINHEAIHLEQQKELGILWFILLYCIEYIEKWFKYHNHREAYRNIIFEREAYFNERNLNYLNIREKNDFMNYNGKDYEYRYY